ncbi:DUF397 domain-containing protein [Actinoalloteichus caeruleus]|uniref:DUF397 domain-containing protein n=1 Tax=Actinoalloteichus cyanogriseus TaxID=2893586 RepID=UPI003AACB841
MTRTTNQVTLSRWHTSSASSTQNCVEIGVGPGIVGVRDSKNRTGGAIVVPAPVFAGFVAAVKDNRY